MLIGNRTLLIKIPFLLLQQKMFFYYIGQLVELKLRAGVCSLQWIICDTLYFYVLFKL